MGKLQSPIDISTANVATAHLDPIHFDYRTVPLDVTDTGHSIQIGFGSGGGVQGQRHLLLTGPGPLS
jgi:carbonic anhydrase